MRAILVVLFLVPTIAGAQTITVDEVLIREGGDLYRTHLQLDGVERALIRGIWAPPSADDIDIDGAAWRGLQADSAGWMSDPGLRNGYAYASVTTDDSGIWILHGMGHAGVYVNGEPRIGNLYGYKDTWEAWEPHFDFSAIPVALHEGENRLLFFGSRASRIKATLHRSTSPLLLNPLDTTLPDLVVDQAPDTWGSIVILNATPDFVTDARLSVALEGADSILVSIPPLPPLGVKKVGFPIRGPVLTEPGRVELSVQVTWGGEVIHETPLQLQVKRAGDNRRITFRSRIDDSVQYYGFLPARGEAGGKALVLSLHGAGVEAINQTGSYAPLSWGHVIAPTGRRPYGFNWEDWGRLDALEILDQQREHLDIDPDRIYLTGHSMGGHGAWHLGTLHPDRFAAVGPSAGWISFWSYRPDQPTEPASPVEGMVQRATLPSHTLDMAPNLADLGVYVLHGADDDNVRVDQAYLMVDRLKEFHRDFVFHEQPDAGHWWDLSDEPGADCVDWAPMFDFFARHRRPRVDEVRHIRFQTPSPGVNAWSHWVGIAGQQQPFAMSSVDVSLDPLPRRIRGTTENVSVLGFNTSGLGLDSLWLALDGDSLIVPVPPDEMVWLARGETWNQIEDPDAGNKGPHRYGSFKEAFTNRVQLVVGTLGSRDENDWALSKARYDAEYLWYQGNGSIDVLPDTLFDPSDEPDRNVVLYGNSDTNLHWNTLWDSNQVSVKRGGMSIGMREIDGDALGVLAVLPRPGSSRASVGIVSGTGVSGFRLTDRRPYLAPGFAYPDFTALEDHGNGRLVQGAGFFGNDWSVENGEFVWVDER